MNLLRPGKAQWAYLGAAILIVLPFVVVAACQPQIDLWLFRAIELPALQDKLGFTAGYIEMQGGNGASYQAFGFTSVVPGGAFWEAGVRPGDVPVGYVHGWERSFLGQLSWAKQRGSFTLRLMPSEAVPQGTFPPVREVTVRLPKSAV
jgi:hypothetical protein